MEIFEIVLAIATKIYVSILLLFEFQIIFFNENECIIKKIFISNKINVG